MSHALNAAVEAALAACAKRSHGSWDYGPHEAAAKAQAHAAGREAARHGVPLDDAQTSHHITGAGLTTEYGEGYAAEEAEAIAKAIEAAALPQPPLDE